MRLLIIASACALWVSPAFSADKLIYRWVDNNNVVHYSEQQPDHNNYTTIKVADTNSAPKQTQSASELAQEQAKKADENDKAFSKELCETAQTNLKTLTSFDHIRIQEDGKSRTLTPEEVETQIAKNKKQISAYCD
ncbi:DUF4124 domain-containing protein [Thalassotalea agarivorans]|uniref:DUF4124 domain-containing protein n=1 Tax=Thalassotalea agarivorans TaxID=349064 RepID=A0A1H9YTV2_THASX|nr:DUF4124 domain-containing protein [Thalassotalea agarivorans]SES72512.1 protein of unknown function [Thalassotalea agarivorans]